jgi:hypothetical protein
MADINKTININVNAGGADNQLDDLTKKLDNVNGSTTRVTQSTNLHSRSLDSNRKSMLDNGGAMGLLGAATGGLAMDFKDAVEAIELTGVSLRGLRGAIIATGIGALAIILLELITNWEKWSGIIDGSTKALERQTQAIKNLETEQQNINLLRSRELAIEEAQGVTEERLFLLRREQNKAQIDALNEQYAEQERLQNILNLTSTEEQLANDKWVAAEEKKAALYVQVNNLISQGEADFYKEQKRLQDLDTQNFIESQDKKINKSRDVFTQGVNLLREAIQLAKQTTEATSELYGSNLSQISTNIILSNKLWYDNQTAFRDFNKSLAISQSENNKILNDIENKYNKLIADATERNQDTIQLEKDRSAALEEQNKIYDENVVRLLKKENVDKQIFRDYEKNSAIIRQFNKDSYEQFTNQIELQEKINLNDGIMLIAKSQLIDLQSKLFEFEKDNGSLGLDNSTKYLEINQRINQESENRLTIIRRTAEIQQEQAMNELAVLNNNLKNINELRLAAEVDFQDKKSKVEKGQLSVLDDEYVNSASKRNELKVKELDAIQQIEEQKTEIVRSQDEVELQLKQETADAKLQIDINYYDKEKALRNERLERERLYYGAVMGIAGESANFLDALINNGHLRDKKAAENALALRKVIGVASVVIAGQEEIRGIWANPSLSALPDTGIVSKTLLTAAAVARGGLSIATILAQKLSGGGSMGTGSAGAAAPQASFNVVGSSSNNQLAATIAAQQQQPVKAYVVGSDVTTQQSLDRNIQKNATFI